MKKGKKTALIVLAILVAVCGIVTYNMVKGYEKAQRSTRNSKKAYQQSREDNDSRFGYGYYVNNHVNPYSMGEIATRSAAIDNEDQLRSRSMASERKEEEAAVRMAVSIAISGIICIAFIVTLIGFIKSRLGEGRTVKDAAITAGKQAAKALSSIKTQCNAENSTQSKIDALNKLSALYDQGMINLNEFENLKREIVA